MTKKKIYFGGFAVTVIIFQLKRFSRQGAQGRFPFLLAVGFSDGKVNKLPFEGKFYRVAGRKYLFYGLPWFLRQSVGDLSVVLSVGKVSRNPPALLFHLLG